MTLDSIYEAFVELQYQVVFLFFLSSFISPPASVYPYPAHSRVVVFQYPNIG